MTLGPGCFEKCFGHYSRPLKLKEWVVLINSSEPLQCDCRSSLRLSVRKA